MANMQEFLQIAQQLDWLEGHLRDQMSHEDGRMADALSALACARAVVEKIAQIGSEVAPARASSAALATEG